MKSVTKRAVSVFVALIMVLSMIPTVVFATGQEMGISVSTVSGCPGDTVTVTINLSNNPGIASLKFGVNYNEEYLTLNAVSFGEGFGAYVTAPEPYQSPQTISFVSPLEPVTTNGLFASLSFKISSEAPDGSSSDVTITYDEDDVFDSDYINVKLNITNGKVQIYTGIPGDVNGDKSVNNKDAILLFRYVAGWAVTVDPAALDVTGDGKINNKDAITLFRYVAGWQPPAIELPLHYGLICQHNLQSTAAVPATCTDPGNIAYWYCDVCGKYYKDANATSAVKLEDTVVEALWHDPVSIPRVDPTATTVGYTEGMKCTRCGLTLVEPIPIPIPTPTTHSITYDYANGDSYLTNLYANGKLDFGDLERFPVTYEEDKGLHLSDINGVAGYKFKGWYTASGTLVTDIQPGSKTDYQLYAHWEVITYIVDYQCDMGNIQPGTYTVNQSKTLTVPTPSLVPEMANYIFLGWTNEAGEIVKTIPTGTVPSDGSTTLRYTANWTSRRNMVKPVSRLGDPIICEDEGAGTILFIYELGTIENVPLYEINRYDSLYGTQIVTSTEKTSSFSAEAKSHYSEVIQRATTQAQTWTLSEDWNTTTNVSETFYKEHGWDQEVANSLAKTSGNNYSLTKDQGGSNGYALTDTTAAKLTGEQSHQDQHTTETGQNFELSVDLHFGREKGSSSGWNLGGSFGSEDSGKADIGLNGGSSLLKKFGIDLGGTYSNYIKNTDQTTDGWKNTVELSDEHSIALNGESNWNTSESFSVSNSVTQEQSFKQAVHDVISEEKSYGNSYSTGGERSEARDYSETSGQSDEYATTLTYYNSKVIAEATTFTTNGANQGSYRTVCAGTMHVFGIVGYDVATNSYYTITYSVLDDTTKVALDYSYDGTFTDYENGVMPFEVPIFVRNYVGDRVAKTLGVIVNKDGLVTGYNGDDSIVFVPAYERRDNGDGTYSSIKITGISENAFKGKTFLKAVVLSDNITEIPANAFAGCTSLEGIFCPGVTSIGDNAFAGCTSLGGFDLTERVTSLGNNAFENVAEVSALAPTKDVALALLVSGAKSITLNIASVTDDLSGTTFTVPATADSFTLRGGGKAYSNIKVVSDAKATKLNRINFVDCSGVPIQLSSETVYLEMVTVNSPRHAMLLKADNTKIVLYGESEIISGNGEGIVCQNLNVTTESITIATSLTIQDDIMACGSVQDEKNVVFCSGLIKPLSEEEYARYLRGAAEITFDANGGSVDTVTKTVYYGENVGELPAPIYDYHHFEGWYTEPEGGILVTADTEFNMASDITVYAHWTINPLSGWVRASDVPADAQVENEKWTYTLREYTSSSDSSKSGWTLYNTERTGWGPTQGPVYSNPSNGSRNVWSEQYVTSSNYKTIYVYYRWTEGSADSGATYSYDTGHIQYYKFDYKLTDIYSSNWYGHVTYKYWYEAATGNTQSGHYKIVMYSGTEQQWVSNNYGTRWYYQEPVYTYYYYRDVEMESGMDPTGQDNVSNVVRWVQYRAK